MTVRVGIIGTSWWADAMYLPALADHPDGAITAVCGRDPDRTMAFGARWGIEEVHTDWEAMLDGGTVDAVIVASPNDTHHRSCWRRPSGASTCCARSPWRSTPTQAQEMVDATTAAGLTTMVPFTYRWMPTNQWIKSLIDDGYVGRPYHLNLRYFTGYARSDDYSWRFDAERSGGGLLGDLGSHWLHVARWWLGEITELGAVTATFFERGPRPDGGCVHARRGQRARSRPASPRAPSGRSRCPPSAGRAHRSARPTTPRSTAATARSTR